MAPRSVRYKLLQPAGSSGMLAVCFVAVPVRLHMRRFAPRTPKRVASVHAARFAHPNGMACTASSRPNSQVKLEPVTSS